MALRRLRRARTTKPAATAATTTVAAVIGTATETPPAALALRSLAEATEFFVTITAAELCDVVTPELVDVVPAAAEVAAELGAGGWSGSTSWPTGVAFPIAAN